MNGAILCRMEEYNMTLHEYIEDMRGKRIAIIGIGVSSWAVSCIWARTI